MKKEMNRSILTTIILLPMVLFLSVLKISSVLKDNLSSYLLVGLGIIMIVAFIFSLFFVLDEIMNSDNKKRVFLLMIFPIFYLPVYYVKYLKNRESIIGYMATICNFILIIGLVLSIKGFVNNYMISKFNKDFKVVDTYVYNNNDFSIRIDADYVCTSKDQSIICNDIVHDKKLEVMVYDINSVEENILTILIKSIIESLKVKGLKYEIENFNGLYIVYYDNNAIMFEQELYGNSLVIVKEKVNKKEKNIYDFQEYFENIEYLV